MSPRKKEGPPPDYPQGPRTVTFADLEEDDWWALLHALEVRIRFFQQQRSTYQRLDDPGLQRQADHCTETIERLTRLLDAAENQIGGAYFSRLRQRAG